MYEFGIYRWTIESGRRIVENEGASFRHNLHPTSTRWNETVTVCKSLIMNLI